MVISVQQRRESLENDFPVWQRKTLGEHFAERCQKYADRPLLVTSSTHYTYEEVWRDSVNAAKAMLALGIRRRDHVALIMDNKPEFVALKIGISLIGAVCIPINTMLQEDELEYMFRQSDVQWLFIHDKIKSNPLQRNVKQIIVKDEKAEGLQSQIQKVVTIPNGLSTVEQHNDEFFIEWNDFIARASSVSDEAFDLRFAQSCYPDEIADIIYTSGTTGMPKGVMLTHDMLLRCSYSTALSRAFEDGRRIFTTLPMYHVFAYVEGFMAASFVGGSIVLCTDSSPREVLKLLEKTHATDYICVPSMLISILKQPNLETYDYSSLFGMMCAAAPAPVPVWKKAVEKLGLTEICTGYGGTEATAATVHTEVGDSIEIVTTRVGRVKPGGSSGEEEYGGKNIQYDVIDPYTKERLTQGSVGEFIVRGNFVTNGYYNKPEENAADIDKDGWFHTGDLGRIDENGYLEFLGRSKDLYKTFGENVAPKEVEEVISLHPAVNQVYVVGVKDALAGEMGGAFIELNQGATCERRDIVRWCGEHLARFKVPRHVWFVHEEDWPLSGTGKVQKFRLRERAEEYLGKHETLKKGGESS
ncbi:AMP-dependent synthetase [Virgibacillus phasianinus]|uniref:AMP-dependent synthetase n=1 Tax=Virgibacillus phasianinus TaxID=2017483 RepID=A0A220U6A9_9BACI|nr:class I adenylate-forming enzyme family protein [Virgibacillus phasianinus]ASK63688.1 AMP-dependent synthetase [Virgibacillus phasianinus]